MPVSKLFIMFVVSTAATIGYSIPIELPKRALIPAALSSGFSYLVYLKILELEGSAFFGAFVAALIMGILSEFLSRHYKMPATIFVLPQLITLVPGGGMYYTMSYFRCAFHGHCSVQFVFPIPSCFQKTLIEKYPSYFPQI